MDIVSKLGYFYISQTDGYCGRVEEDFGHSLIIRGIKCSFDNKGNVKYDGFDRFLNEKNKFINELFSTYSFDKLIRICTKQTTIDDTAEYEEVRIEFDRSSKKEYTLPISDLVRIEIWMDKK